MTRAQSLAKRSLVFAMMAALFGLAAPSRAASEPAVITGVTQEAGKKGLALRIEFNKAAPARLIALSNPDRIVLDLTETVSAVEMPSVARNPLVTGLRHGLVSHDQYRLIFSLAKPVVASMVDDAEDGSANLTIEFAESPDDVSRAEASDGVGQAAAPPARDNAAAAASEKREFVVVVDPGHGGIDLGAEGQDGTLEKDVNLAFGLTLKEDLEEHPDIRVILTREADEFIALAERSAIARRAGADLFVSIHSDSIRYPELRGATVYTLSERASDALSGEVADSENASDRFVNPLWRQDEPEVLDILADLTRRETVSFSEHFAERLVDELGDHDIRLIKNPKRSAGFRVLKAPDVPSVLVELGYLSNRKDEKLLTSDAWRQSTAEVIAGAISDFIKLHAPGAGPS